MSGTKSKRCNKCDTIKMASDFYTRTYPNGTVVMECYCKSCKRAAVAERRRRNPKRAAEIDRKARAKYLEDPANRERKAEYDRTWQRERMRNDPVYRARVNANRRIDARLRAAKQGEVIGITRPRPVRQTRVFLDAAPLIKFIKDSGGIARVVNESKDEALARSLRRIVADNSPRVELHVVDALLFANDLLFHDLYDPNIYPEVFAA